MASQNHMQLSKLKKRQKNFSTTPVLETETGQAVMTVIAVRPAARVLVQLALVLKSARSVMARVKLLTRIVISVVAGER